MNPCPRRPAATPALSLFLMVVFALIPQRLQAQEMMAPVHCTLPLWDMPFNSQTGQAPSMGQSLAVTTCFYGTLHEGLARGLGTGPGASRHSLTTTLSIAAADILSFYLPPGTSWLHEEWHRAVMTRNGISSYNEVYKFPIGEGVIQVSRVRDDQLARLKAEDNPDLVRLAAAGIESGNEANVDIERRMFYQFNEAPHQFILLVNALEGMFYVQSGSTDEPDRIKEKFNRQQHRQDERDFVGHDVTSWMYDLNRPDEPYANRGPHPLGDGIDRYRGRDDLNSFEQRFLKRQGLYSLLNLVDPIPWGKTRFSGDWSPGYYIWGLHHYLTSFGADLGGRFLYMPQIDQKWFARLHLYQNAYRWFPGVEVERIDWPVSPQWALGMRGMIWQQPHEQAFRTRDAMTGGLGALRLSLKRWIIWNPYVEVEGKTEGWVAGNTDLGRSLALRLGIHATLL